MLRRKVRPALDLQPPIISLEPRGANEAGDASLSMLRLRLRLKNHPSFRGRRAKRSPPQPARSLLNASEHQSGLTDFPEGEISSCQVKNGLRRDGLPCS